MFSFFLIVGLGTNPPCNEGLLLLCFIRGFFNCLTYLHSLYLTKLTVFERKCEVIIITQYLLHLNFSPRGL